MPTPFPGMDPYIERPAIWADFHNSLISCIRGQLQPLLRPRYVAISQERLFVVDSSRPICSESFVLETRPSRPEVNGETSTIAVVETAIPVIFPMRDEKRAQPYLEIIEPDADNRIVTAIEVLSPDNKVRGPGQRSYVKKRTELWQGGANIVEIDLLRAGRPTVSITAFQMNKVRPWNYLSVVLRRRPSQREVYPIRLINRLPKIKIPLAKKDNDVVLDLQAAFTRCYDEGPYPGLLHYDEAPPGEMTSEDSAWCVERLRNTKGKL